MSVEINATNFPDATFRELISVYDSNSDGILSDNDITNITVLNIPSVSSYKGLELLTSLQVCSLRIPPATTNITSISLTQIRIDDNSSRGQDSTLINLTCINCLKLRSIRIPWQYAIETLTVSNCPVLEWLDIYGAGELHTVTILSCPELKGINLWGAQKLKNLDLGNLTKLEVLRFDHANLDSLIIAGCTSLKYLIADAAQLDTITSIDLTGCTSLRILDLSGHHNLTTLTLPFAPDLHTVDLAATGINVINLSNAPILKDLVESYSSPIRLDYGASDAFRYGPMTLSDDVAMETDVYPLTNEAERLTNTSATFTYPDTTVIVFRRIAIITQPQNLYFEEGDEGGTITVEANGTDLYYAWEILRLGESLWTELSSSPNASSLYLENIEANNQAQIRCRIYNTLDSIYTETVICAKLSAPIVITQPANITTVEGTLACFTLDSDGVEIQHEWQFSVDDGVTWEIDTTFTSNTYSIMAENDINGYCVKCRVYNNYGETYSNVATLTVTPDSRSSSPAILNLTEGQSGTLEISITDHDEAYQWQASGDEGETWTDLRGATNPTYNILATLAINGYRYRCVVTIPTRDIESEPSVLTVTSDTSITPPVITTQPSSVTVAEGSSVTFAVVASGNDIHYQWQVFKNNQWTNIQNSTTASYTTVGTRLADGNRYRCVISNAAGAVSSDPATLTVTMGVYVSTPRVLTQPRSVNVELGELVTFWIRADGGDLSYQWQKLNNGTWYDITGAVSPSYSLMARTEVHNTQYRCVISNTAGSAYSNTATLSIRAGHDLSFYGYHSIIISGKNTYGEWEMYPTSRPHVAPPEVKTNYVDLPGADGGLDYTDLLTGEPRYGYRKGSWEFLLIPQDRWAAVYRSLVNFLHGRQHTVILEDDPNYVYTGRLSVNKWQSDAHNSLITIDYTLEPFPRNISGQEEDEEENRILSMASTLLNKEKYAGMAIGKLNGAAILIYPDMLFDNGDNIAY